MDDQQTILDAIAAMRRWCRAASRKLPKIHKQLHENGEQCSNVKFLAYAMHEIERAGQDADQAVGQFMNAMNMLQEAAERIDEQLEGKLGNTLPDPPIQVANCDDMGICDRVQGDDDDDRPKDSNGKFYIN